MSGRDFLKRMRDDLGQLKGRLGMEAGFDTAVSFSSSLTAGRPVSDWTLICRYPGLAKSHMNSGGGDTALHSCGSCRWASETLVGRKLVRQGPCSD
jgi:hypothetical protein